MKISLATEAALAANARQAAQRWSKLDCTPITVGLEGELGAGKTTWARALLGGLGHTSRVPSPTFTLLEHYEIGTLTVVHLDLYRLADARELEFLGIGDWLALPRVWLLVEWPSRSVRFANALDLNIEIGIGLDEVRTLDIAARSPTGKQVLEAWFR